MTSAQTIQGPVEVQGLAEDGVLTVTIRGELDAASIPALYGCLAQTLQGRPRLIVFDLAGVGFMDCAAAAAIIRICHALPGGPRLVLRHPRPVVRRLLSLTGFDAQCAVKP